MAGPPPAVIIVDDASSSPAALLEDALERSGFWNALTRRRSESTVGSGEFHVLIKPDLGAFAPDSPTATDPRLIEALIDRIHDMGYPRVDVCAAPDSSLLWAENRDVAVLADLLGYRYVTSGGREYDVLDLGQDLGPCPEFPRGGVLDGSTISETWRDAGFRVCFARNKTDEDNAYALCLESLLDVLPLVDKDYYYRHRIAAGDAVADLIRAAGPEFALIDATLSAHGAGGSRSPKGIRTHTVIASESALLVDFVGALKMGIDPHRSRLADAVFNAVGLPATYTVDGSLGVYPGWENVHPLITDSHRRREASPTLSRLLKPWLQTIETETFPLKHPIDASANRKISPMFRDVAAEPAAFWALVGANYVIGGANEALNAYRTLYDKDALRPVHVPLGLRLEDYTEDDYRDIVGELSRLEIQLAGVDPAAEGLRWRFVDKATVFDFTRELVIDFDEFVRRVDVSRTIQHMTDYIGGVVVPVSRDSGGRALLQAERNLYLPQPNYLVLSGGKPIDVSKLEVCDYTPDRHRMFWKTVKSENRSAACDDGIIALTRTDSGTRVQITGKQLFVLPPLWQAMDLDLTPEVKAALVTDAYARFFATTCANFEALVEGRDIRIGRPWHEPRSHDATEALPVENLARCLREAGEKLQEFMAGASAFRNGCSRADIANPVRIDADGFRHFRSGHATSNPDAAASLVERPDSLRSWLEAVQGFYLGLATAVARDAIPLGDGPDPDQQPA